MGYLKKRTRRGPDGKRVPARFWTCYWKDGDGRLRSEVGFADKQLSRALLTKREQEARLGRVDFGDPYKVARRTAVAIYIEEFLTSLLANGVLERSVNHVRPHLVNAFAEMGASYLGDVRTEAIETNLLAVLAPGYAYHAADGRLRTFSRGLSFKTRNHRLAHVKQFYKWLVERGLWANNPASGLKPLRPATDPGYDARRRRALTAEQLEALVAAARERPWRRYAEGHRNAPAAKLEELKQLGEQRVALYTVAALMGLRRGECRQLLWADIRDLDADVPRVTIRASIAKAKREDVVPVPRAAAAALREWRVRWCAAHWRKPKASDRVFSCVGHNTVKHFQADCRYAGIDVEDGSGKLLFHSLRHSQASLLARAGVPISTAQTLTRHRDPRTLLNIYTHVLAADRLDAIRRLPDIGHPPEEDTDVATR